MMIGGVVAYTISMPLIAVLISVLILRMGQTSTMLDLIRAS